MSNHIPTHPLPSPPEATQMPRSRKLTPYVSPSQYQSRLPLPKVPTTPLPPPRAKTTMAIPYIHVRAPSLPVSRVLFPTHPLPQKWREHPGLSRIPRLTPTPETPTPPGRKRARIPREISSAPGSPRNRDRGWSIDGRVRARRTAAKNLATPPNQESEPGTSSDPVRTWPVMDMERLSLHERRHQTLAAEEEVEDGEDEGDEGDEEEAMSGVTQSLAEGGKRRTSFRRLVKRIRRSFSKVTLKLRE